MSATPTDKVFFARKLWLGISRWTWVRLAFALMFCMSSLGLYQVQHNSDQDNARTKQATIEQCDRSNAVRQVVRDLVTVSYNQGGALDLSLLPHYGSLDPETKSFIDDLNQVLTSSATPEAKQQRTDQALASVPLLNCTNIAETAN